MSARMAAQTPMRPTYVGIGAQKCASTWLHHMLQAHPQVCVPEVKEVDFFSYRYDRGYQWYERCFVDGNAANGPVLARGEFSPSYFCEPAVPERVAAYLPEAKIIVSLREPVQRALSNHRHEVKQGNLTGDDLSFERGLRNNPMYIEQGLYATHLRNWLQHFPRDRILVVLMEDVESDPRAVCELVYQFLGVDPTFIPTGLEQRYNRSFATRSAALSRVKDVVYGLTRLPGMSWLWQAAAGAGLRSMYRGINNVPSSEKIPTPQARTLAQLRQRFEPEVRELETMIGRSLQTWLA
jgi:Sulfotransferase domain